MAFFTRRDLYQQFNTVFPSNAKQLDNGTTDQAAWLCTTSHATCVHPIHGYGHKSCVWCKKMNKNKMLDYFLPKTSLFLNLVVGTAASEEQGHMCLKNGDSVTAIPVMEHMQQLFSDMSI